MPSYPGLSESAVRKRLAFPILNLCRSTTGKYLIFYGQELKNGTTHYVFGAVNTITGTITKRTYSSKETCLIDYDEFRAAMQAKRGPDETQEEDRKTIFRPN